MTELPYIFWSSWADVVVLNIIGVTICIYSLYVELRKESDPTFQAACDFNEHMSCSRVLTSKYAHGLGLAETLLGKNHILNSRNCNLGMVMFALNLFVVYFMWEPFASTIMFYSGIVSILTCIYLASVLAFVLKDFCLVCVMTYIVNGCLLYLNYWRYNYFNSQV